MLFYNLNSTEVNWISFIILKHNKHIFSAVPTDKSKFDRCVSSIQYSAHFFILYPSPKRVSILSEITTACYRQESANCLLCVKYC